MNSFNLQNNYFGLKDEEILTRKKLKQVNIVSRYWQDTYLGIVVVNTFNILNILVFIAGLIVWYFRGFFDFLILVGILMLNLAISLTQEIYAKHKINLLRKNFRNYYEVIRNGKIQKILATDLVLDDIFILQTGQIAPVDGLVLEQNSVLIDTSALTGESEPESILPNQEILAGNFLVAGFAVLKTNRVGDQTKQVEILKASNGLKRIQTPIQKVLTLQIQRLLIFILLATILTVYLFIQKTLNPQNFALFIGIIASTIPVTLLTITSLNHSLAALRLQKHNILVQRLAVTELLSSLNILNLDKTGTITTGNLSVVNFYKINGESELSLSILKNYFDKSINKNPTSLAIQSFLSNISSLDAESNHLEKLNLVQEIPFSSSRKYLAHLWQSHNNLHLLYFGAPEKLLNQTILETLNLDIYQKQGLRVLLVKEIILPKDNFNLKNAEEILQNNLLFTGQNQHLFILKDEIKSGISEILAKFQKRGVNLKFISGDHPLTVASLLQQLGFDGLKIITGDDLEKLETAKEWQEVVVKNQIFARTTPQQKQKIIQIQKQLKLVNGMVGDGLNDIPAMQLADISISFGKATEAARSKADLVILNDDFSNLSKAIYQSQKIQSALISSLQIFLARVWIMLIFTIFSLLFNYNLNLSLAQNSILALFISVIPGILLAWLALAKNINTTSLDKTILLNLGVSLIIFIICLSFNQFFKISDFYLLLTVGLFSNIWILLYPTHFKT
jgi:cation-transporting ATPase E